MAAGDLVKVRKIYTNDSVTTNGVDEEVTLDDFLKLLPTAGGAGDSGLIIQQTAPAAAPVPFADLTAAANYANTIRTLLIAAKVFV